MGDATATGYAILGIALALIGALVSLGRVRAARSFYAADVYHMTARSHRRFAFASAAFAVAFAASIGWPPATIPLLAVYVLLLVLYGSSFARGFSSDDE